MRILTTKTRTGTIRARDPSGTVVWQIGNRMSNTRALYLDAYDNAGIRMNAPNVRINNDIIAESGSNSNGHWVRFYDGTQMCWHKHNAQRAMTSVYGTNKAIFRTASSVGWTYPKAFSDVTSVVAQPTGWRIKGAYIHTISASAMSYYPFHYESATATGEVGLLAIGRWK